MKATTTISGLDVLELYDVYIYPSTKLLHKI